GNAGRVGCSTKPCACEGHHPRILVARGSAARRGKRTSMRRLRAYVSTVWSTLSRVGRDPNPTEEARAVAAGSRFSILSVAASLPWVIGLAVIGGPEPAPAATHAVMVLAWAAGLWFNRLGMSLLAATLALIAPLMQYAYLTDVYSRGAAFHLNL